MVSVVRFGAPRLTFLGTNDGGARLIGTAEDRRRTAHVDQAGSTCRRLSWLVPERGAKYQSRAAEPVGRPAPRLPHAAGPGRCNNYQAPTGGVS